METSNRARVCVTGSIYVLFIYLLISDEEDLNNSYYFITDSIKSGLKNKLGNCYVMNHKDVQFSNIVFTVLWRKYKQLFGWRFLKNADFFGLDYYWFIPYKSPFNYIEDAPEIFKISSLPNKSPDRCKKYWKNKCHLSKIFLKLLCGPYYMNYVAIARNISRVYKTQPDDKAPWLDISKCVDINIRELWSKSSQKKREWILNVFSLSKSDIDFLNSKKIILYTQQFFDDKYLSEIEHMKLYEFIIQKYPSELILIKTHPRDTFPYEKYFPNIPVFRKNVPSQLLMCLGENMDRAVTVSSSAVRDLPPSVQIDWYGNEICPKLLRHLGHQSYVL